MLSKFRHAIAVMFCLFVFWLTNAQAAVQVWNTTAGDWAAPENWTTAVPVDGDDVVITNLGAFVLLTNSTAQLGSLVISNANLSCSNWGTTIYVTNLAIMNSGVLTCAGPFTNSVMSNRVNLTCTNLFIATNGAINVNGKGFAGGIGPSYGKGNGPGGGGPVGNICGAGHGGEGINGQFVTLQTNTTYDLASAPLFPGSGGAGGSGTTGIGGAGGGAVCITAVQMIVNGSISANASNTSGGSHCSGGSGGGIYITCTTITGTNGAITADAGPCQPGVNLGGGAGGGRIAVIYDKAAQSALTPRASIRFSASSSRSGGQVTYLPGDIGTLYFSDNYFFDPTNMFTGAWLSPEPVSMAIADWTASNVWVRLSASNITVTNTLTVAGTNSEICRLEITNDAVVNCGQIRISSAALVVGYSFNTSNPTLNLSPSGPKLNCAGDLILTNYGQLIVSAGLTNEGAENGFGARVNVAGDIKVVSNCWILPVAHSTNGAAVLFGMRNLTLDQGGGINANSLGYGGGCTPGKDDKIKWAFGPGAVPYNGGAGYGGHGGTGYYYRVLSPTYGSSNAPLDPGSGASAGAGSSFIGPFGGGSVQLRATGAVTVQGTIAANGGNGNGSYSPGASGGGIYITCRTFIGNSNGGLLANGGNAKPASAVNPYDGGGGGGGRIAVWRVFDKSPTTVSNYANGGVGAYYNKFATSEPGTIVWGWIVPPSGSIVSIY